MPANPTEAEIAKKKRQQSIVVVLLAILLLAILTQPRDDRDDSDETNRPVAIATTALQVAESVNDDETLVSLSKIQNLPSVSLAKAMESELFPIREVETEIEVQEAPVATKRELEITAVFISDETARRSVLINGSFYTVGDPLPDGRRIKSITMQGIELD